jgi:hypothetical protein
MAMRQHPSRPDRPECSRLSVSGYETGRVSPGAGTIFKLAETVKSVPSEMLESVSLKADG